MASECGVKVFCRCRPLNESEKSIGGQTCVKFPGDGVIGIGPKSYQFDRVFNPDTLQEQVYKESALHIVQDVLSGYNGTIFAYGQTSSGKTHTMEGVMNDPVLQGIIPRIVQDIFAYIYNMDPNLEFVIKVSYFEIYMERIRDLLDTTKTNLAVHEDKNRVPYVKDVTERYVSCPEEVMGALNEGKAIRQVANTNMNEHSSRSHSVFLIQVKQQSEKMPEKFPKLSGKLYLVDLAGSEKVGKTGAEGTRLDEAKNINQSLSCLGNVISALAEGVKTHIPYRDSKLTRILQESLGGNARTTVIICCSPATYNEMETKSTLQFGQRAKTIKNSVQINEEVTAEEWKRRYMREREKVLRLRNQLSAAEMELLRWRKGDKVPESDWVDLSEAAAPATTPGSTGSGSAPNAANQLSAPAAPSSMANSMIALDRSIMNTGPLLLPDAAGGAVTDEERLKYETERAKMYQQLDEKDDEIQAATQMSERLKQELAEQEGMIEQIKAEYDGSQSEIGRMQQENDAAKEEVKEVLQALEELALNYDQKQGEADLKHKENEQLADEINKHTSKLNEVSTELQLIKESTVLHKRRTQEMLTNMLKDLSEVGAIVGGSELKLPNTEGKELDEEFTTARLFISKMKTDIKDMADKYVLLESGRSDTSAKMENNTKELLECKQKIQQYEVKLNTATDSLAETEKKKRGLEEQIDGLNELCSQLKAGGAAGAAGDAGALDESRKAHAAQVATLRDEIDEKQKHVDQLKASLQELELAKQTLEADFEKLKAEDGDKEKKLKELAAYGDKRTQAQQDLKGLEETVTKELQTLHNLRKIFVQGLEQRVKRTPTGPDEDEFVSSAAQKQKINFLENNLDQLTKVHKQLVRDNADLRCELPKLEKRLRATMERVKSLEGALKDAKESSTRDRKKYQQEVERIKEAVRQRNLARRGMAPQIAKPIRPGQPIGGGAVIPVIRPGGQS